MSVVRIIPRRSRLTTLVDSSGGVSVGAALRRAKANLQGLQGRGREIIDARLAALETLSAPAEGQEHEVRTRVFALACEILDAANLSELDDLCTAAHGLCDLSDPEAESPFDWRVAPAHARAMKMLLALPAEATAQRSELLAHLAQLRDSKIGGQTA
jgi:hypothetical protein